MRQGDDNSRQGESSSYEEYLTEETCSATVGRESQFESTCVPHTVSPRLRHGKWNFYAVRRGRRIGVFGNWPDYESQVKYYSGVKYKGFNSEKEAIAFVYTDRL